MISKRHLWAIFATALAIANAVIFPLWAGYRGGHTPLDAGIEGLEPYLVILAANATLILLLRMATGQTWIDARGIVLLAIFTRVLYLATRIWTGNLEVDQDIELFFNYGRDLAAGHYPAMEYPQGALLLFTGGYLFSADQLDTFRIAFPLIMLFFDLVLLGCLLWLGKRFDADRTSSTLGVFYAISPFTLVLWFSKFDIVPAALYALGVCLFVSGRRSLAALTLGTGFLTKWFPGIAIAFIVVHLWRNREYRPAFRFAGIAAATILLPMLVSWLISPSNTLHTYTVHADRPLMGESLLYLPVALLEPTARLGVGAAPWDNVLTLLLDNRMATGLLVGSELLLVIALAFVQASRETAVTFASMGVAVFILLNRVFSPQYLLVLYVAYAMAFIVIGSGKRDLSSVALMILILSCLNYLIWPAWSRDWVVLSALFFGINILLLIWIGSFSVWPPLQKRISDRPLAGPLGRRGGAL